MNQVSPANPLSLHHLTALDVSPPELVSIAAALACDHVCLFTQVQDATRAMFPCVEDEPMLAAVAARCADTGVTVHNLEYFPVEPDVNLDSYRGGLERGARLGARRATAHIHDPEPARATAAFAALCDLAGEFGLRIGLEFTAFSQIRSLEAALRFVGAAGRANADVVLDALHFFRSGGDAAALGGVDLSGVGYVQLCDGPLRIDEGGRMHEAVAERGVPGEGEFALGRFVAALPAGPVIDVEVPQSAAAAAGVSPMERSRRAVTATRRLIAGARAA
jgi:sugar phosphate isomerase/epimerase